MREAKNGLFGLVWHAALVLFVGVQKCMLLSGRKGGNAIQAEAQSCWNEYILVRTVLIVVGKEDELHAAGSSLCQVGQVR